MERLRVADVNLVGLPSDLWRVHKAQYGPLNPPPRSGTPDQSWSRFDIPGWAVLYAASTRVGAYLESLAYAKPAPLPITELFNDEAAPVHAQWADLGHMAVGQVARQWRDVRELSSFHRHDGLKDPVVDLASAGTIAYLRETVDQWAPPEIQRDPLQVDLSLLTGGDRRLTTQVAWWLSRTTLPTGAQPIGLRYPSRHGTNLECYALWVDLDRYGPATPVSDAVQTQYRMGRSGAIEATDKDLHTAAELLGVSVF